MDPFNSIDFQLALLRSNYRATTSLPVEILLANGYPSTYYPVPIVSPYLYPYVSRSFYDYPVFPGWQGPFCRHHRHHHHYR